LGMSRIENCEIMKHLRIGPVEFRAKTA